MTSKKKRPGGLAVTRRGVAQKNDADGMARTQEPLRGLVEKKKRGEEVLHRWEGRAIRG